MKKLGIAEKQRDRTLSALFDQSGSSWVMPHPVVALKSVHPPQGSTGEVAPDAVVQFCIPSGMSPPEVQLRWMAPWNYRTMRTCCSVESEMDGSGGQQFRIHAHTGLQRGALYVVVVSFPDERLVWQFRTLSYDLHRPLSASGMVLDLLKEEEWALVLSFLDVRSTGRVACVCDTLKCHESVRGRLGFLAQTALRPPRRSLITQYR